MHLIMCSQLNIKSYEKISHITPAVTSNEFMKLLLEGYKNRRTSKIDPNEIIFKMQSKIGAQLSEEVNLKPKGYFKCGDNDHIMKECRANLFCSFCGIKGYTIKECTMRIAQSQINKKYFSTCDQESRNTNECLTVYIELCYYQP